MTPPPNPPATESEPDAEAAAFRQALHELIGIGMDIARALRQQAIASPEAPGPEPAITAPQADIGTAYDRVSRAIRRSMLLARRLGEPQAEPAQARHRVAARRRILREVEDTIQRRTAEPEASDLHAELLDRLDSPELEEEIADRPTAEIIEDICRDLGIAAYPGTHPWKRRTPDDIASLCARAARPPARRVTPAIRPAPRPGCPPAPPGASPAAARTAPPAPRYPGPDPARPRPPPAPA
jgi:hypothetical protein